MKKRCAKCDHPSVPGLIPGVSLCQYHYDVKMFGQKWADDCHPTRKEVVHKPRPADGGEE